MDTFVAIGLAIGVFGFSITLMIILKKLKVDQKMLEESVDIATVLYSLVRSIIEDTGYLTEREELETYFNIVEKSIVYMRNLISKDKEVIINEGIVYATGLYVELGFELTDARKSLIKQMIKSSYSLHQAIILKKIEE